VVQLILSSACMECNGVSAKLTKHLYSNKHFNTLLLYTFHFAVNLNSFSLLFQVSEAPLQLSLEAEMKCCHLVCGSAVQYVGLHNVPVCL
jgi:hypothetical protein